MEQEVQNGVPVVSFLMSFALVTLGAYWHYRKVSSKGRHMGSLWQYIVSTHPGWSGVTFIALLGAAWEMTSSGTAQYIDPVLLWTLLVEDGIIHPISVTVAISALSGGYFLDSQINKGDNE